MRSKILAGLSVTVMALLAGIPASAQDADGALGLLPDDPNGFIRVVQEKLADAGLYGGRISGTLNRATVAAINAACRDAGLLADCQTGPLTPRGSAAVIAALATFDTPEAPAEPVADAPKPAEAVEPVTETPVAETPEPEVETAAPAAEAPAAADVAAVDVAAATPVATGDIAPSDWSTPPTNGLSVEPVSGDAGASFSVVGTATGGGWINLPAKGFATAPGASVSLKLTGSFVGDAEATVRLAARRQDGSYLGEIRGAVATLADSGEITIRGVAPEGTGLVVPYIRIAYPDAAIADGKLSIVSSSFETATP